MLSSSRLFRVAALALHAIQNGCDSTRGLLARFHRYQLKLGLNGKLLQSAMSTPEREGERGSERERDTHPHTHTERQTAYTYKKGRWFLAEALAEMVPLARLYAATKVWIRAVYEQQEASNN